MQQKETVETIGRINSIDPERRIMWVKDEVGVTFELKWREKPEAVDDLCRKQKRGFRVKVTTVKNPAEENAKFWITNVEFDENYKKRKSAYAPSPEEQKLILLQSCQRSGAIVFAAMLGLPNIQATKDEPLGITYDAIMNKINQRAIADAKDFLAEAKKP